MSAKNESRLLLAAVGSPGLCLFRRGPAHQWPGEHSSPETLYQSPVLQKEAGLQGRVGCQGSDGSTLGVLRSPQTKAFHIVRALIQSPVFLLFSVAFGLGHKALNQHSAEPGKSETKAPD